MNPSQEKIGFSWLHLSGIHSLHGDYHNRADQKIILEALNAEIKRTTSDYSLSVPRVDAIFITGDISFSGAEENPDEYNMAEKWLSSLACDLGIGNQSFGSSRKS
jgi:hypothetical protein